MSCKTSQRPCLIIRITSGIKLVKRILIIRFRDFKFGKQIFVEVTCTRFAVRVEWRFQFGKPPVVTRGAGRFASSLLPPTRFHTASRHPDRQMSLSEERGKYLMKFENWNWSLNVGIRFTSLLIFCPNTKYWIEWITTRVTCIRFLIIRITFFHVSLSVRNSHKLFSIIKFASPPLRSCFSMIAKVLCPWILKERQRALRKCVLHQRITIDMIVVQKCKAITPKISSE